MRNALIFLFLVLGGIASAQVELTAQSGLVPWKAVGRIDNLAARAAFEKFLMANPAIRIVEFERLWLPGQYWGAGEVMSVAGNAGPDIMSIKLQDLARFVRGGLVQSLDDLYEAWEGKDRHPESLARSLKLEGRVWGVAAGVSYALLAADRQVFAERGLSQESMPKNWDELVSLAGRLRIPGRRYGLIVQGGKPLAYLWMSLAWQAGGEKVASLGPSGLTLELSSGPSVRAAEFLVRMGESLRAAGQDTFSVAETDVVLRQTFVEEKAALALVTSQDLDAELLDPGTKGKGHFALQPRQPLLAPVPGAFASKPLTYVTGGGCMIIPSYISDPEVRNAIWNFHTNATVVGGYVDRQWLEMAMERQVQVPSTFAMRYPRHPAVRYLPAEWGDVLRAATADARAMPPDPRFEELAETLGERLTILFREGGDASAVLARTQAEFDTRVHNLHRRTSAKWRVGGWLILGGMAGLLILGLVRLALALRDEYREYRGSASRSATVPRVLAAFALFIPAFGLAAVFGVLPLLNGLRMSLHSRVLRDGGIFVGAANYLDVVISPDTHLAVMNTLVYLLISFVLGFLAPFALALMLANLPRARFVIRSAFFLPAVASAVVIAIIWQQMYDFGGPFNDFAALLGFAPRRWLEDPGAAMFAVVNAQAWSTLGVAGLTYLAGLSMIPEVQYEDAEILGAGLTERFLNVTYPHIRPLLGINLVGWLVATTRTAEHVFLTTGGGPDKATHVIGLEIFNQAYVNVRFGYAMAQVWLLVAIVLMFSIYQVRAIRAGQLKMEHR